jgi:methylthioribose-1-phosphate isomerase
MVVAPTSSIDGAITQGSQIEIEERRSEELLPACYANNPKVRAWNPVFDVTPAGLISAIVTERGVVLNPAEKGMNTLLPA